MWRAYDQRENEVKPVRYGMIGGGQLARMTAEAATAPNLLPQTALRQAREQAGLALPALVGRAGVANAQRQSHRARLRGVQPMNSPRQVFSAQDTQVMARSSVR